MNRSLALLVLLAVFATVFAGQQGSNLAPVTEPPRANGNSVLAFRKIFTQPQKSQPAPKQYSPPKSQPQRPQQQKPQPKPQPKPQVKAQPKSQPKPQFNAAKPKSNPKPKPVSQKKPPTSTRHNNNKLGQKKPKPTTKKPSNRGQQNPNQKGGNKGPFKPIPTTVRNGSSMNQAKSGNKPNNRAVRKPVVGRNSGAKTTKAPKVPKASIPTKKPHMPNGKPLEGFLTPDQLAPAKLKDYATSFIDSIKVGPHNVNMLSNKPIITNVRGVKILSCQFDCTSTFPGYGKLFNSCQNNFFSYGTFSMECETPQNVGAVNGAIAIEICGSINNCVPNPDFPDITVTGPLFATAEGLNADRFGTAGGIGGQIRQPIEI